MLTLAMPGWGTSEKNRELLKALPVNRELTQQVGDFIKGIRPFEFMAYEMPTFIEYDLVGLTLLKIDKGAIDEFPRIMAVSALLAGIVVYPGPVEVKPKGILLHSVICQAMKTTEFHVENDDDLFALVEQFNDIENLPKPITRKQGRVFVEGQPLGGVYAEKRRPR